MQGGLSKHGDSKSCWVWRTGGGAAVSLSATDAIYVLPVFRSSVVIRSEDAPGNN